MNLMKKAFFLTIVGCILAVMAISSTASAKNSDSGFYPQKEDKNKCWPMDVVLLVDQSFSMFEHPQTTVQNGITTTVMIAGNDPQNYRYLATKIVLREMFANRQDQCPEAVHRLGVVTFGDKADAVLDMVPFNMRTSDTFEQWAAQFVKTIDAASTNRTQNGTDFKAAFQAAENMLKNSPPPADKGGYLPRKRLTILLTDGNPQGANYLSETSVSNYMCDLVGYLDGSIWRKNDPNNKLYVVALKAGDDKYLDRKGCSSPSPSSIRGNWTSITGQRGGSLQDLVYNYQAIELSINNIVLTNFGQPGREIQCNQDIDVDPYLQSAIFKFYRKSGNEQYTVVLSRQGENGVEFRDGQLVKGIYSDPIKYVASDFGTEDYVFTYPVPGKWVFRLTRRDTGKETIISKEECARNISASFTPLALDVKVNLQANSLPQFGDPPYYDPENPLYHLITATINLTTPLKSYPEYPLKIEVSTKLISGTGSLPASVSTDGASMGTTQMKQSASNSAKGVWESSDPIKLPIPGRYEAIFIGRAPDSDKGNLFPVFTYTTEYVVRSVERIGFAISSPAQTDSLFCSSVDKESKKYIGRPMPVAIQIFGADGKAMTDIQRLGIVNADKAFEAWLVDENDKAVGSPVFLSSLGKGQFEGKLLDKVAEVSGCGKLKLKVAFKSSYDSNVFFMKRMVESRDIERQRAKGLITKVIQPVVTSATSDPLPAESMYSGGSNCIFTGSQSVYSTTLRFNITDLEGNAFDVSGIGSLDSLFSIRLVSPDGKSELAAVTADKTDVGLVLKSSGGFSSTVTGKYTWEILPNLAAFAKAGYSMADDKVSAVVERTGVGITSPGACAAFKVGSWVLLAALIGLIAFAITGGPGGTLMFLKANERESFADIRLPTTRIETLFPISKQYFGDYQIKQIFVKRDGKDSLRLRLITTGKSEINATLNPFEIANDVSELGVDMRYEKGVDKTQENTPV